MNTLENKVNALMRLALCNDEGEKQNILDSLREMMGEVPAPTPVPASVAYRDKIVKALLKLGTPDHILGHKYAVHAITLVIGHPEYIKDVTSVIYPEVAKEFNTTPSRVERAIRHAIEVTWDRGSFDVIVKYFGNTVNPNKGKPTNSEFISRMANALR